MQNTKIRLGKKEDLAEVLEMIRELAVYEKAGNEVETTVSILERDGFGEHPLFHLFVAEQDNDLVGMALYYFKYSTWKGKCVFLEDIIVKSEFRGLGLGQKLFEAVIGVAKREKVKRMEWQVLDWNEPAINFYKKYNANLDPEWINGKLVYDQIQSFKL